MRKIFLELDVSGTIGNEAWNGIGQPKGFIAADLPKTGDVPCAHTEKEPHSSGEWREVSVQVEEACAEDAVLFYKMNERVLAVETED